MEIWEEQIHRKIEVLQGGRWLGEHSGVGAMREREGWQNPRLPPDQDEFGGGLLPQG